MKRAKRGGAPRAKGARAPTYVLRLYVSGGTRASTHALTNLKALCDDDLAGRYELEVIDVHDDPERVAASRIVATPTLLKERPLPVRLLVGDLSQRERVLVGLGVRKKRI